MMNQREIMASSACQLSHSQTIFIVSGHKKVPKIPPRPLPERLHCR